MIGRRPEEERWTEEDDEELPPPPWWKRYAKSIGVGVVATGMIAFIFTRGRDPSPQEPPKTPAAIGVVVPYVPPTPEPKPAPEAPPKPPIDLPLPRSFQPPTAPPTAGMTTPAALSFSVPQRDAPPKPPPDGPDPAHTGIKFSATTIPGIKASPAIDETYILMPGLLPCVLESAIDSSWPGPLMCHLPGPVYSPAGVLLMEAGTQVMGRYESMTHNGSARLQATSTFAHTPKGVWVMIAGPMADDQGRSGLAVGIDNKYLERFGGAVLMDLSQAALGIVQASVAKGGSAYLSFNSTDNLANEILRSEINKPPVGTKHFGDMIAIWLTGPIDFSDSYRVSVRQ